MGQGHSIQDVGVQRSKSRQSTRSLPDNSRLRRSTSSKTTTSTGIGKSASSHHGVYVGGGVDLNDSKTASELWWKDAAPYYSAPAAKHRPGPRSLDMGYGRPGDAAPYHKAFSEAHYGEVGSKDAWSDVASDMYRIREKSKENRRSRRHKQMSDSGSAYYDCVSERSHHRPKSSARNPPLPILEMNNSLEMETQSDVFFTAASDLKPKKCRSIKEGKESRSDYSSLHQAPQSEGREEASPARPKRLSAKTKQDPPPRPPKSTSNPDCVGTAVPGEQWVDFPPALVRETDLKVTFDEKRLLNSKQEAPVTPPKSPGSVECDKLIIQSMRRELSEERALRLAAEGEASQSAHKIALLEKQLLDISNQLSSFQAESEKLSEDRVKVLESRLSASDERMRHLSMEKEQYQAAYGKCLDDIAKSVARALMQQKSLKSECLRLQKRVMEVEWEKRVLQAQLQLAGLTSPSRDQDSHNNNTPAETPLRLRPTVPGGSSGSKGSKYRQSMGSDPTLQLSGAPDNTFGLSESLASITSQHFMMYSQDSSSPLSNGGEGLCSRPQSFSFDVSATSSLYNTSSHVRAIHNKVPQPDRRNPTREHQGGSSVQFRRPLPPPKMIPSQRFQPPYPQPPPPPLGAKPRLAVRVSPLDRLKDLENEDLFGDDDEEKPRNFGQVETGTQGFTDFYSSSSQGPSGKPKGVSNPEQGILSQRTDLNLSGGSSVVEKMRAGNSGSSIGSLALLGSVLNGEANKEFHSTPKSSPHKGNLSGASDEGSTTPTLSETAFSSTNGDLDETGGRGEGGARTPSISGQEEVVVGYVEKIVVEPRAFQVLERKQRFTAVVNPTRHTDDGYSTLIEEKKPHPPLWTLTDKATSTQNLPWNMMDAATILTTSSSATRSISSGFESDLNRNNFRALNSDDRKALPLQRWSSDSKLLVGRGGISRVEQVLRILLGIQEDDNGKKWTSWADLTSFEKDQLMGQGDIIALSTDEMESLSVGESREGLFDLSEARDVDLDEITRAFQSIEALASERGSLSQYEDSFYALCNNSTNIGKSLDVKVGNDGERASDSESPSNDDSLSPQGRIFLEDVVGSTSSSYTSEDSEDDGAITVQAWLKQLKRKPKKEGEGISCVRYSPRGSRKSILKPQVFARFGNPERSALATFDFLQDHPTDLSSSSPSPQTQSQKVEGEEGGGVKMRKKKTKCSRDVLQAKRLSRSLNDVQEESEDGGRRRRERSSLSSILSDDSYNSSLLLSDLCAVDASLSSSSSLSLH